MRPTVAFVATVIATGALASCSSVGDLLAQDEEHGPPVAKVVVLEPEQGSDTGATVLAAVRLAMQDREPVAPGWTVTVDAADGSDPAAVEALAKDDNVVGVVGGLTGQEVRAVQPVLAGASILLVSPVDVAPEHTRGADPANPLRPYSSYFRTAVPAGDPVRTAADFAVTGLGAQTVAIINGGGGDAARFAAEIRRLGGEVVASALAGADSAGITKVMAAAVSAKADVVYVSGDAGVAADVAKRLAGTGLDARLVGGAELRAERFVREAGTAAEGAVAVIAPLPRPNDGSSAGDIAARLGQPEVDGPSSLAAAAHDAGAAMALALSRCLPPEDTAADARKQCAIEMARVSFAGATGEVAFDAFGDRVGMRPQVFEVHGGAWVEVGSA